MILLIPISFSVLLIIVYLYRRGDLTVRMGILLIISMVIPWLWAIIKIRWPETEDIKLNLWLSKKYRDDPNKEDLSVLWYFFGVASYLAKVIIIYVAAQYAALNGFKDYRIFMVGMVYYIIQFGFWLWNMNTDIYANFIVYLFAIPLIIYLCIDSKKWGIIKQIDNYD